jgi:hypothetical protein
MNIGCNESVHSIKNFLDYCGISRFDAVDNCEDGHLLENPDISNIDYDVVWSFELAKINEKFHDAFPNNYSYNKNKCRKNFIKNFKLSDKSKAINLFKSDKNKVLIHLRRNDIGIYPLSLFGIDSDKFVSYRFGVTDINDYISLCRPRIEDLSLISSVDVLDKLNKFVDSEIILFSDLVSLAHYKRITLILKRNGYEITKTYEEFIENYKEVEFKCFKDYNINYHFDVTVVDMLETYRNSDYFIGSEYKSFFEIFDMFKYKEVPDHVVVKSELKLDSFRYLSTL